MNNLMGPPEKYWQRIQNHTMPLHQPWKGYLCQQMPKVVHRQLLQENYLQKGKWEIREAKSFPPPNTTNSLNSVTVAHTSSPSSAPTNRKSPPPPSPLPAKAKPVLFNQLTPRARVGMLKLQGDWLCALQRAFSSGESDSASFPLFISGVVAKAACKAFL